MENVSSVTMKLPGSGNKMLKVLLICIIGLFLIYSFYIEPNRLTVTHITIKFENLNENLNGLTVLHLSDLHLNKIGKKEKKLLETVNQLNPDILVITGDFVNKREMVDDCIQMINKFKAKYGKWGVWGNNDHCILNQKDKKKLAESEIVILGNENQSIAINQQNMWIIGVDDPVGGHDNLSRAMGGVPEEGFKLLLSHSPAIIEEAHRAGIELVLAGHTHGGQVYIPLISHLIVRLLRGKGYIAGLYSVGQTYLYVSRGIGTSILPLRAFCPPEITLIKLEKEKT
ncbi:hypothetical protein B9J78_06145 [bacterium Unc6]|nr:hypothetical protein [bacterium Unc6]